MHRLAEHARRQRRRARSRPRRAASASAPASRASSSRWPTPHCSSAVELDGQRVLDLVGEVADADPEPLAQERAHGVLDEAHEVVELDQRRADRRAAGRRGTAAGALRGARERPGALRA